jgi:hypothetical protein
MKNRWILFAAGVAAVASVTGVSVWATHVDAADHNDPPGTGTGGVTDNPAADIDDVYVWHDTTAGTLTAVITFSGPTAPTSGEAGVYNANTIFQLHVDTDPTDTDFTDDLTINIRFGQNTAGEWGIQVQNLPGTTADVVGAVETTLTPATGVKVFAGLRDDPFFFDLDGLHMTLATSALHFDHTRDSFAGKNTTAIVLEMPLSALPTGVTAMSVWASSGVAP